MLFRIHSPRTRVVLVGDVEEDDAHGDDDGVDPTLTASSSSEVSITANSAILEARSVGVIGAVDVTAVGDVGAVGEGELSVLASSMLLSVLSERSRRALGSRMRSRRRSRRRCDPSRI